MQPTTLKDILRRLLAGLYALFFSALLLGLSRYSYRAKELLVCWLFFCSLFALLAVLFLGGVLTRYAVHHLLNWMSAAKTVMAESPVGRADIPQEAIPDPRILAAETFKLLPGAHATVDALDYDACPSIDVPPSAANEQNV